MTGKTTSQQVQLPDSELIPLDNVRFRLAVLWLAGAAAIIIIMVVQSLLNHYDDKAQEAWSWLLPTLTPTLGMVITVLGYTALDSRALEGVVRNSFFQVAFWLSSFYLFLILLTLLIQPFAHADAAKAIQLMRLSNIWLGPIQGFVASALGVLFVSKRKVTDQSG